VKLLIRIAWAASKDRILWQRGSLLMPLGWKHLLCMMEVGRQALALCMMEVGVRVLTELTHIYYT
jgi:hypothetical protein